MAAADAAIATMDIRWFLCMTNPPLGDDDWSRAITGHPGESG
jgi:hypothetical protein